MISIKLKFALVLVSSKMRFAWTKDGRICVRATAKLHTCFSISQLSMCEIQSKISRTDEQLLLLVQNARLNNAHNEFKI